MSAPSVVIYDAGCAFCSRWVRFIARADRRRALRFTTRFGAFGRRTLKQHPGLDAVETVILVTPSALYIRSDAAIRMLVALGGPWQMAALLLAIPKFLRDPVYRLIAMTRRRLMRGDACALGPGLRELHERTID